MTTKQLAILIALVLTMMILGSCSDDDSVAPPTPPAVDPVFTSPEQLLQAFLNTYENQDFALMQSLLHPDYVTILQVGTQQEFPSLGATLDLTKETRIAGHTFSGEAVVDPDGNFVSAISSIAFDVLEQQGPWVDSGPNGAVANSQSALFDVIVTFDSQNADSATIQGAIKFFAVGRDTVIDGVARTAWKMIGQQNLTDSGAKAVERVEWGKIKAIYR